MPPINKTSAVTKTMDNQISMIKLFRIGGVTVMISKPSFDLYEWGCSCGVCHQLLHYAQEYLANVI